MSQEPQKATKPNLEKRLVALENQCFFMYLQLNALTKLTIKSGSIDKEQLTKEMNALNKELKLSMQRGTAN